MSVTSVPVLVAICGAIPELVVVIVLVVIILVYLLTSVWVCATVEGLGLLPVLCEL